MRTMTPSERQRACRPFTSKTPQAWRIAASSDGCFDDRGSSQAYTDVDDPRPRSAQPTNARSIR